MKIGTLVARAESPNLIYRVTSSLATDAVKILPYERSGKEVVLIRSGRQWTDGHSVWVKV